MARRTATFVKCDFHSCSEFAEVIDASEAPENWYRILPAKEGKYSAGDAWEFHSLACLSRWARERKAALDGKPQLTRSSEVGSVSENIRSAFELKDGGTITAPELIELTGHAQSTVNRILRQWVDDGEVEIVEAAYGTSPARYRLTSSS